MAFSSPVLLPPHECDRPYTVAQINAAIAAMIEQAATTVWVEGEISNLKRASSGHCYLTLKDGQSQIPAVIWRFAFAQLKMQPENGMAVTVIATIRVYQKGGYYQLDIQRMQPSGLGALYAALEQLKRRLEQEGLFDAGRKKPLPQTVRRLGVVTSKQGAAIRDILKVVSSRAPQVDVVLIDVAVQGAQAAFAIAQAIHDMNRYGAVDCMIVGRGGGSMEDLWAFNEEAVVRAIAASAVPVISAVGHETDFTLSDFAADVRAPTPSAAAEIAVHDTRENQRYYQNVQRRFSYAFGRFWNQTVMRYRSLIIRSGLRAPALKLAEGRQKCDELHDRLERAMRLRFARSRQSLEHALSHLNALSPWRVLARGYSVVCDKEGRPVRSADQLAVSDLVRMRFHQGAAQAQVVAVSRPEPEEGMGNGRK